MNSLMVYPVIKDIPINEDFGVRVREIEGEWKSLSVYEVKVDMHEVRKASFAYFDMKGPVEVEIDCKYTSVNSVIIRPLALGVRYNHSLNRITFRLEQPSPMSIEINDDRFRNLHLFANPPECSAPRMDDANVHVVKPGIHRIEWLETEADILYFAPGVHYIEETIVRVPSGKTIYIDGGAAIIGSFVCDQVQEVTIRGRGMIYLADFHRFSAFRGIRIMNSEQISIDGVMIIDVPHYSVYIGGSRQVNIKGLKSFSTRGWSDGIDIMSSSDIDIDGVFMRNSDDCIAIYGSRWGYRGDSRRIRVRNSVLWADVAHPLMIGTHGDHHADGDIIEDIRFENIDILEHHERQPNYWGAMAINAGDGNTVRKVVYDGIRVESIEQGQLFDLRVVHNKDYNPIPGRSIENIEFRNIEFAGEVMNPSRIHGFDSERVIDGVIFTNVTAGGQLIDNTEHPALNINEFASNITFIRE